MASAIRSSSNASIWVWMGIRSWGGVLIIDMSRDPIIDMCNVRGIGVAVSVRTSTKRLSFFSFSLCRTPNRCSSSTTRSPRSRNSTSLERSRCVPIKISIWPFLVASITSFCC